MRLVSGSMPHASVGWHMAVVNVGASGRSRKAFKALLYLCQELCSTRSANTLTVSPAGRPTPPAKGRTDLQSSTNAKSDADTLDYSKREDGITDEECKT